MDGPRSVRRAAVGVFVEQRGPHKLGAALVGRADLLVVAAGLSEAQTVVGAASDLIRVVLVLAVVFPETDLADLVRSALGEGDEAAARAAVRSVLGASSDIDVGHGCILVHQHRKGRRL